MKDSKYCRDVWCCDNEPVCHEFRQISKNPKYTCWKVWCCADIQDCHPKPSETSGNLPKLPETSTGNKSSSAEILLNRGDFLDAFLTYS